MGDTSGLVDDGDTVFRMEYAVELLNFWLEAPGDAAKWLRGIIVRRADYSPAEPRYVSPELISQALSLGGGWAQIQGVGQA